MPEELDGKLLLFEILMQKHELICMASSIRLIIYPMEHNPFLDSLKGLVSWNGLKCFSVTQSHRMN